MSNGYDPSHDYTDGGAEIGIDDIDFSGVQAAEKSADQIEAENSFEDLPPGQYQLAVVGFLGKPEPKRVDLYCKDENGVEQRYGISTFKVTTKLGLAEDRSRQVTDNFLVPPTDPGELYVYLNGSTKASGQRGFSHANKFYHFIERLFPGQVAKGQALGIAGRPSNWIGREIVATVVAGNSYTKQVKNTDTGDVEDREMQGRNQIKLFSYREAGTAVSGPANPTAMRAPGTPAGPNGAARPAAAAPRTMPTSGQIHTSPQQPRGPVAPQQRPAAAPQQTRPAARPQPVAAGAGGDRGLSNI